MKYFRFKVNRFFLRIFSDILNWQYRIFCKYEDFTFKDFEIEQFFNECGLNDDSKGG